MSAESPRASPTGENKRSDSDSVPSDGDIKLPSNVIRFHNMPQPNGTGEQRFDINVALKALATDSPQLTQKLEQDEATIRRLRQQIVGASRKNFILERELNEIDEKIKLLIKNRITVQEVLQHSVGLSAQSDSDSQSDNNSPLKNKKHHYEDLFYLLQSKPRYLAALARLISGKEIPTFVQTVVFDMYGDQYDTREERLLLSLFRIVLKAELDEASEKGSLLRANTAITQMLSAYARRGQGLSILKDILEEPLRSLTSQKDLNLEINPMKVYIQMITDYETKSGKQSDLPRSVTDEVAAANPQVRKLIEERRQELLKRGNDILQRIIDGVDNIPYGMRWICKQLGVLSKQKFPDADRYQIGSLMGGYIYLRFFNPVIVTPDAINFISTKPSRIMRRNLILIAKVLQNLSNGLLFGDKEVYMKVMNDYIESRMDPLQDYFQRLVAVDDLEDALQVDKYLEHTSTRMNVVQINYNQVFQIHAMVERHLDLVAPNKDDPIRSVLKALGPAPPQVAQTQNRTVSLQLSDRRSNRISTLMVDSGTVAGINPLYLQAKKLLLSVLRCLPAVAPSECPSSLMGLLEYHQRKALSGDAPDAALADSLANVISMLKTLQGMGLLEGSATVPDVFDNFLWQFGQESLNRRERMKESEKKMRMIESAMTCINNHHDYLVQRLELYKQYLENVRKGQAQTQELLYKKGGKKEKKKVVKFTHPQMEDMGVVVRTSPEIAKSILKKCYYSFSMVSPGKFQIEVHMKKGVDISLLKKPVELVLEELLRMQEHGQTFLELDYVSLNVNLLIHLLNTQFIII